MKLLRPGADYGLFPWLLLQVLLMDAKRKCEAKFEWRAYLRANESMQLEKKV